MDTCAREMLLCAQHDREDLQKSLPDGHLCSELSTLRACEKVLSLTDSSTPAPCCQHYTTRSVSHLATTLSPGQHEYDRDRCRCDVHFRRPICVRSYLRRQRRRAYHAATMLRQRLAEHAQHRGREALP